MGLRRLLTPKPRIRVRRSTNQSISNSTNTAISFDTTRWHKPTASMWEGVTNPTRVTIRKPGLYTMTGHINWDANGTGARFVWLQINGTTRIGQMNVPADGVFGSAITVTGEYEFAAGDYVELFVFQTSGGALNSLATGNYGNELAVSFKDD